MILRRNGGTGGLDRGAIPFSNRLDPGAFNPIREENSPHSGPESVVLLDRNVVGVSGVEFDHAIDGFQQEGAAR